MRNFWNHFTFFVWASRDFLQHQNGSTAVTQETQQQRWTFQPHDSTHQSDCTTRHEWLRWAPIPRKTTSSCGRHHKPSIQRPITAKLWKRPSTGQPSSVTFISAGTCATSPTATALECADQPVGVGTGSVETAVCTKHVYNTTPAAATMMATCRRSACARGFMGLIVAMVTAGIPSV